jgi:Xaa-Pro dipeptidase
MSTSATNHAGFFTVEEHHARIATVREDMVREGLDAVCVTGPEDVYYLTGLSHQGHFAFTALVLPVTGEPAIVAREMEHTTLSVQVPWCRHVAFRDHEHPADAVLTALRDLPAARRLGMDKAGMWFPIETWERVSGGSPGVTWSDTSRLVARHREVKSAAEIACITRAAALSSAAMEAGIAAIRVGVDVKDVAAAIYADLVGGGSEYPGMAPFIRFRDSLLQEHVTWQSRTVEPGDALFVEMSASVGRYHAPLTRMAYVGEPPAGTEIAAEIASAGLAAVTDALVPGTPASHVYAAWQRVVDRGLGHDRYRRHHCGYQVGIGFPPSWVGGPHVVGLRSDSRWQVRAGMTFHVLSWLLDQEPADFVLSDTVLVTDRGGELLTDVSRQPIVVPL